MQNKNTVLVAGIVLVTIVLGGWFLMKSQNNQAVPTNTIENTTLPASSLVPAPTEEKTITITSSGFSPQQLTVKAGDTVTWINNDSNDQQVNSVPHPSHTNYPPLNTIGLLKPGEKKSLSFPATGTYKYHDHLNPSLSGSVVVE